jgi:hypothetical protein
MAPMATDVPPQGSVILYPYLWLSQREDGETEGRKERPTCLLLSVLDPAQDIHHLLLLAISSQPPNPDQTAMEVPAIERRRAGLNRYPNAWIVISEYNYDIAERSYYYEPNLPVLGRFSAPYLREIAAAVRHTLTRQTARIDRTL